MFSSVKFCHNARNRKGMFCHNNPIFLVKTLANFKNNGKEFDTFGFGS
jgi:hypothetical protein